MDGAGGGPGGQGASKTAGSCSTRWNRPAGSIASWCRRCASPSCASARETGTSHGPVAVGVAVGLTASAPAQALPDNAAADEPVEDLVHVPVGRPYVWPSGIGLLVAAPTSAGSGAAAVVRVRTTVLNESAAPYDL